MSVSKLIPIKIWARPTPKASLENRDEDSPTPTIYQDLFIHISSKCEL